MSRRGLPGYWMNETTGVLRPAVEAYLTGGELSEHQVAALRAYLRQWIMAPAWDQGSSDPKSRAWLKDVRSRVDQLEDRDTIRRWLDEALEFGIDPL